MPSARIGPPGPPSDVRAHLARTDARARPLWLSRPMQLLGSQLASSTRTALLANSPPRGSAAQDQIGRPSSARSGEVARSEPAMRRARRHRSPTTLSAAAYWALRADFELERILAGKEGRKLEMMADDVDVVDSAGNVRVRRVVEVALPDDCIPSVLRRWIQPSHLRSVVTYEWSQTERRGPAARARGLPPLWSGLRENRVQPVRRRAARALGRGVGRRRGGVHSHALLRFHSATAEHTKVGSRVRQSASQSPT